MAKQKMKKTSSKQKKTAPNFFGRHKLLTGIGVVVLGLILWRIIYVINYNHRVNVERAQFMAVKADLHVLAQQIAREVGQPTESKEVQECHYASRDFGLGPLGCLLSTKQNYNLEQVSIESINGIIEQELNVQLKDNSANSLPSSEASRKVYIFSYSTMSCGVDYSKTSNQGVVDIYCSKDALKPYFPVFDGSDYLPK
ncbi:MAG: hypothetical protein WAQ24_01045 [Candidatus Saccharimonadales bacterium]